MPDIDQDFLDSLADMISYCTDPRSGVEPDGQALAAAVTDLVRERYATRATQAAHRRAEIRAAVRNEFNGRNCREIMERYGISRRTVYRYLK